MTIICEGGDRCGKSTVCQFLKENGYLYYHFDYPKKEDVVQIYLDYFQALKSISADMIYDRAMYSEYAYSRYYHRPSSMDADKIYMLEQEFRQHSSDGNVCILYLENEVNENLALLEKEGEGKILTIQDILRLRKSYYEALKLSSFPIFTYNYQFQDIRQTLKSIHSFFKMEAK